MRRLHLSRRRSRPRAGLRTLALAGTISALSAGCGGDGDAEFSFRTPMTEWRPGAHGSWAEVPAPATPWNVILITLDTTRADRMHCYGWPVAATPNIDRMAREGVRFARARTPIPLTLPAHTSIMTGLLPFEHGVRNNGTYQVPERRVTLAELLKQKGYATGAIVAGFPVAGRFGLNQGFDSYDDAFSASSVVKESDLALRPAGDVTRLGIEWIQKHGSGPFFLWTHYYDPHHPYEPPEPYRSQCQNDFYQGEIAYMDAEVGRLLDAVAAQGLLERTVVIIAGDHGESLGEHGENAHSIFIYGATQDVPLVLRLPEDGPFAGKKWHGLTTDALVSHVDLLPTVWNALGLPRGELPPVSGKSLLPLILGQDRGADWVYGETLVPQLEHGWSDLRSLEVGRYRFIRAPRRELYDVVKDPKDLVNLEAQKKRVADRLEAELNELLRADTGGDEAQAQLDPETIEKLRSLGYLSGVGDMPARSGPPADPKDRIGAYEAINRARTLTSHHNFTAALAEIDSVLARDPEDHAARRIRAECLLSLGRGQEAIEAFDKILLSGSAASADLALLQSRAMAALLAHQLKDAEERIRALIETHPKEPGLHSTLSRVLQQKGDLKGALAAAQADIELLPGDPKPYINLAGIQLASGDRAGAEKNLRQALTINTRFPEALAALAEIMVESGREAAARGLVDQALSDDPHLPSALFRKAWFLAKDNEIQEATRLYQVGLQGDPENVVGLFNLGNLFRKQGDAAVAMELYRKAIATGNAPISVYVNLGVCLAERGDLPSAITIWEAGIAKNPTSPEVPSVKGNVQMAKTRLGQR